MADTSVTPSGATYSAWFDKLLSDLGIPQSQGALQGLADVVHEEGANSYNNPFNIEWHPGMPSSWKGTSNFNSVGVQEYANQAAGLSATEAFLQGNSNWDPFLSALRTGSRSAVDSSLEQIYTWGNHFSSGASNTTSQENATLNAKMGSSGSGKSTWGKLLDDVGNGVTLGAFAPVQGISGAISSGESAFSSVGDVIKFLGKPDNWIKIGFIVLGFCILLIGVDKLSSGAISGASDPTPTQTIDVVTGSSPGNSSTVAGRAVSGTSKSVRFTGQATKRGTVRAGKTATSATRRAQSKGQSKRDSKVKDAATTAAVAA